jgi:deoxyribose-phosphate aldolase
MSQPSSPPEVSRSGALRDVRNAIEHTLLASTATPGQVDALCDEAAACGLFAVCVNPLFVARCKARLAGTGVRVVTVVGFPLASSFLEATVLETELAVRAGADEIDAVLRLSAAKSGDWGLAERDARAVVEAASGRPVKLILETALLTTDEIDRGCAAALAAGVRFVKTSTGYAGGATVEAVAQLRRCVGARAGIKASGGIRTSEAALSMLEAGADRIGTSAGAAIARAALLPRLTDNT